MDQELRDDRYVDPTTDFGFKHLFGSELNKELLIAFLNAILQGERNIVSLKYLPSEHLGTNSDERKAIFDVYCEDDKGERFIVEMQNASQIYYKDRSIYYSSFPICEQAVKSAKWNYELKPVYMVGILNFVFVEDKESDEYYHHKVMLMDTKTKKVFYDKLTFHYIELPKFKKNETELATMMDKWVYFFKNLSRLMERPAALQERVFSHAFKAAEIAQLSQEELRSYEATLRRTSDFNNMIDTARSEGETKGANKKNVENAKSMKALGVASDIIQKVCGLSQKETDDL